MGISTKMISSKSEQMWYLSSFNSGNQGITFMLYSSKSFTWASQTNKKNSNSSLISSTQGLWCRRRAEGAPLALPQATCVAPRAPIWSEPIHPSLDGSLRGQRGLGPSSLSADVKHRPWPGGTPETPLVHLPFLALQSVTAAWSRWEFVQNALTKIILVCLPGRRLCHHVSFRLGRLHWYLKFQLTRCKLNIQKTPSFQTSFPFPKVTKKKKKQKQHTTLKFWVNY